VRIAMRVVLSLGYFGSREERPGSTERHTS